jgi:hypothetical protein
MPHGAGAGSDRRFADNTRNCVLTESCEIKDTAQHFDWVPPEGGGPNYSNVEIWIKTSS